MSRYLSLESFQITRPQKIKWRAYLDDKDILETLKSKSLKAFLSQTDQVLTAHQISYRYYPLTKEQYLEWLKYYTENMIRHGYDAIATAEWYDDRRALGRELLGMFLEQQTGKGMKLVASGIFTQQDRELGTFAFKASERIKISKDNKGTLGAVLDYLFLREMLNNNVKNISAGRSRNAFGFYNTLGYLSYNLRFGFVPSAAEDTSFEITVPLNEDGTSLFYGVKNNIFSLFSVKKAGNSERSTEFAQLSAPEVPYQEIEYSPEQVISGL